MQKYNAMLQERGTLQSALGWSAAALVGLLAGCASHPQTGTASTAEPAAEASDTPVAPVSNIDDAVSSAGDVSLRREAPLRYVVKKGDTLWSIAKYFLSDPSQWPELWYVNGKVQNPHLIYPGEVLKLVLVNGRTRLTGGPIERLSPRVRDESLDDAIPTIPLDAIRQFLKGPRVVSDDEIEKSPYVLAFVDDHINGSTGNGIYVQKLPKGPPYEYDVMQIGSAYIDPDTGDKLGYEALPAGHAELRNYSTPSEMILTDSVREVLIGDRLFPSEADLFQSDFYPHAPKTDVNGTIIALFDGFSIAQYEIVTINRGSDAGIDPGTVLSIYQAGRNVPDPFGVKNVQLPEQYAGVLMIFKVSRRLSYGLVLSGTRPSHILDKVHKPLLQSR